MLGMDWVELEKQAPGAVSLRLVLRQILALFCHVQLVSGGPAKINNI